MENSNSEHFSWLRAFLEAFSGNNRKQGKNLNPALPFLQETCSCCSVFQCAYSHGLLRASRHLDHFWDGRLHTPAITPFGVVSFPSVSRLASAPIAAVPQAHNPEHCRAYPAPQPGSLCSCCDREHGASGKSRQFPSEAGSATTASWRAAVLAYRRSCSQIMPPDSCCQYSLLKVSFI
jgi:hypothetical protein